MELSRHSSLCYCASPHTTLYLFLRQTPSNSPLISSPPELLIFTGIALRRMGFIADHESALPWGKFQNERHFATRRPRGYQPTPVLRIGKLVPVQVDWCPGSVVGQLNY